MKKQDLKNKILRTNEVPNWLKNAKKDPIKFVTEDLLSKQFLKDSLIYVCAGGDGNPIKYYPGLVKSYIYIDMCYALFNFSLSRYNEPPKDENFYYVDSLSFRYLKGYHIILDGVIRDVEDERPKKEGSYLYNCRCNLPFMENIEKTFERKRPLILNEKVRLKVWKSLKKELSKNNKIKNLRENDLDWKINLEGEFVRKNGEILFTVYHRDFGYDEKHGPEYLCLTFISGGGVTHYYHLYNRNKIAPKVLCVENPGAEFIIYGENGVFKDILLMNEGGMPQFLMGPHFFPLMELNYYENITKIVTDYNYPQLWKLKKE